MKIVDLSKIIREGEHFCALQEKYLPRNKRWNTAPILEIYDDELTISCHFALNESEQINSFLFSAVIITFNDQKQFFDLKQKKEREKEVSDAVYKYLKTSPTLTHHLKNVL